MEPPAAIGGDPALLRLPPHSPEAESSVLGGLLLENGAWDQVADLLGAADFYRFEHRLIWEALERQVNASRPADVVTTFEELQRGGHAESCGGLPYLNALAQSVPSAGNIRRYAEIVRERSTLRRLVAAADETAAAAFEPQGRGVEALLDSAEQRVFQLREEGAPRAGAQPLSRLLIDLMDHVAARADAPLDLTGVATGFAALDEITSGLQPGDLIVLAARPGMGKTSLSTNIAEHVAIALSLPVAVFSMEMSASQLAVRIVGSIARIDQTRLRTGRLHDDEWERLPRAAELLRAAPLHIDETPGLTVGQLRSSARRLARRCGGKLGLIVVDYLQLMTVSAGMSEENRATALGEIARGLKMLAKELRCPLVALSQLSRAVESRSDRRPVMSDLRESGAIEQDADVIMFIYRDDYYNKDSKEPGVSEILVSKQRNGPTGTVKLAFIRQFTKFVALSADGL